ncbi:proteasome subunit alpha type-2-like [Phragmites australis]|uniref:proteasome subunit alpha type-2-like n=1 Tax=Phragmites australis TaxID=29695 RepID=UPI002D77DEF7|nr:proteasome subunit alpha type-2-like [Phragmites australis]
MSTTNQISAENWQEELIAISYTMQHSCPSAANGAVIATEKKLPSILVDETSVKKIQVLTPNIGVVYRKLCLSHNLSEKLLLLCTSSHSLGSGVRPFGVSLLIVGYDDNGPQLYQVDPSGSYFSLKASAMGGNVSNAKTFLEKRSVTTCAGLVADLIEKLLKDMHNVGSVYFNFFSVALYTEDMELDDAIHTAILTLKEGYEGQISSNNIEIGIIRSDREFKVLSPAEIQDFTEEVE